MGRLLRIAVVHQDFVSRLWLTVALHEDADARVVIFAGSATELLSTLERVPVNLVVCGGDYAQRPAKALRRELWQRGLPVVAVRNPDSPASRRWLLKWCLRAANDGGGQADLRLFTKHRNESCDSVRRGKGRVPIASDPVH